MFSFSTPYSVTGACQLVQAPTLQNLDFAWHTNCPILRKPGSIVCGTPYWNPELRHVQKIRFLGVTLEFPAWQPNDGTLCTSALVCSGADLLSWHIIRSTHASTQQANRTSRSRPIGTCASLLLEWVPNRPFNFLRLFGAGSF